MSAGQSKRSEHLTAEMEAGRPVQLGRLTATAAVGGGLTLTDAYGASSTYRTVEDFDDALAHAQVVLASRRAAGWAIKHGQAAPSFAMAFTAARGWELQPCPPLWALDLLAELP